MSLWESRVINKEALTWNKTFLKEGMIRVIVGFLLLSLSATLATKSPHGTIILNMIVRGGEVASLRDCLGSVANLIDGWVIVNVDSSTGSIEDLIKTELHSLPGELHEREWVNFGHNRQEALELALDFAQRYNLTNPYILTINAGDRLTYEEGWKFPPLVHDAYRMTITHGHFTSKRSSHLIRATPDWSWEGVVHETLYSGSPKIIGDLEGIGMTIGSTSEDIAERNALLLEEALTADPTNSRNWFYLAQSYYDGSRYKKALTAYRKRVEMGGWDEEIYLSLLRIAEILEKINAPDSRIELAYRRAIAFRPQRLESYFNLAHRWRIQGRHEECWQLASAVTHQPMTTDSLFVVESVYRYGLMLEQSVCAYWSPKQRYWDTLNVSYNIHLRRLTPQIRKLVRDNYRFALDKASQLV